MLVELEAWSQQKPDRAGPRKPRLGVDSKSALGPHSPADEDAARKMATQAVRLARQAGRLMEAADLMEEACNRWPGLREEHEYRLQLWRRGIVM